MVIDRKYEWLGILYENDPAAKKLINEALKIGKVTKEWKKRVLEYNHSHCPAFLGMGCGLPGESYRHIMDGLEELDKKMPYDNGLTFSAVTDIEYETSRRGNAIQMRLVNKADGLYRIIGFVAVENKDNKMRINKGWDMWPPYTIG